MLPCSSKHSARNHHVVAPILLSLAIFPAELVLRAIAPEPPHQEEILGSALISPASSASRARAGAEKVRVPAGSVSKELYVRITRTLSWCRS